MINTRNINKSNTGTPILERTVKVSRVAKVIKGGRTLRFTATIVVGNGNGKLGMGSGKAKTKIQDKDVFLTSTQNVKSKKTFTTYPQQPTQ